jgi:hypothetical protein
VLCSPERISSLLLTIKRSVYFKFSLLKIVSLAHYASARCGHPGKLLTEFQNMVEDDTADSTDWLSTAVCSGAWCGIELAELTNTTLTACVQ